MSGYIRFCVLLICAFLFKECLYADAARILVIVSTPMFSHQIVFRPFTQELATRGHQVVVITTDPAFPSGQAPQNLTEIDVHDLSYNLWTEKRSNKEGKHDDYDEITVVSLLYEILIKQLETKEVKNILSNQQFDLVVTEFYMTPTLALAHYYRAPAILVSTFGSRDEIYETAGAPTHPILYPDIYQHPRYNLSVWKQVEALYKRTKFHYMQKLDDKINALIRKMDLGVIPPVQELKKNVALQYVNMHPMWEGYRPSTLNVVHLGGLHCVPPKALPADITSFMDSSKNGVIYMSFANQVSPGQLPSERMAMFARVFAKLPFDVMWKWKNAPEDLPNNVRTFDWQPQADLLRHEKLLLFITQGGLQSTDEALSAGVPLLGFPMMTDQWVNTENYERFGVGLRLDLFTFTEKELKEAIEKLIYDKSYRERSLQLVRVMQDQPLTSLERAVWWTERVIRLRGRSMETPPPPLTWNGLIQALMLTAIVGPFALILFIILLFKLFGIILTVLVGKIRKWVFPAHWLSRKNNSILHIKGTQKEHV